MAPLPAVPSLLVPVSLAALCVGDDDYHQPGDAYGVGDFAAVATDFSALPYVDANGVAVNQMANLASNVVPPPFTPVESKLPIGIHLHWALPAALSKGSQGADRKLAFPSAPNRWLIVRTLATHPATGRGRPRRRDPSNSPRSVTAAPNTPPPIRTAPTCTGSMTPPRTST